jgi:N-acetylglutamate synthase-like GNAT family acetyltransferase
MELAVTTSLPVPKVDVSIRVATMDDIAAIDALQKPNSRELGFFPRGQLQGYIEKHGVLIAEASGRPIGYVAYADRYLKRDELGIIVQLCVEPGTRRSFVGMALVKAVFERSPYGCKMYCCWCAQDIAANMFWESMGFSAIAFRTGSTTKGTKKSPRIHIFWQRRIRAGDTSTPFWFPSKTEGGALAAQRLVLPIPPGTHWSDAKPVVLPETADRGEAKALTIEGRAPRNSSRKSEPGDREPIRMKSGPFVIAASRLTFAQPTPINEKKPKQKRLRTKPKFDKRVIDQARELRDRYLEQYNGEALLPASGAKYDVSRTVEHAEVVPMNLLAA